MVLFLKEKMRDCWLKKMKHALQSKVKKTRLSDMKPQCAWSEAYNPTDQKSKMLAAWSCSLAELFIRRR